MKDDHEDISAHEVDTEGRIQLTHHFEHVAETSVIEQRALEGLP